MRVNSLYTHTTVFFGVNAQAHHTAAKSRKQKKTKWNNQCNTLYHRNAFGIFTVESFLIVKKCVH